MTADEFRRIALSMPEAVESEHMGHPDFRVKGRIFATLFRRKVDDEDCGMVKLTLDQQRKIIKAHPKMFQPIPGGWGARGATQVNLDAANKSTLRSAMLTAWRNTAPKRLIAEVDDSEMG